MHGAKLILVHLIAAVITGFIGVKLVVTYGPDLAKSFEEGHLQEGFLWLVLVAVVVAYFIIIWLVHFGVTFVWFRCSKEYQACGLFIEGYFKDKIPTLSLMVVYFDLRKEELKIVGHSYCFDDSASRSRSRLF
jgi:hypothetical protein